MTNLPPKFEVVPRISDVPRGQYGKVKVRRVGQVNGQRVNLGRTFPPIEAPNGRSSVEASLASSTPCDPRLIGRSRLID